MSTDDTTTRRRVLKLSGAAVATVVGAGAATADCTVGADVETKLPNSIDYTSAGLQGELLDTDCATYVDVWFEWGEKGNGLPNETPGYTVSTEGTFSETIDGLVSGTTYEYRALSDNGVQVETGSIVEFTTDNFSCDECVEK